MSSYNNNMEGTLTTETWRGSNNLTELGLKSYQHIILVGYLMTFPFLLVEKDLKIIQTKFFRK
jgi:hypothetical protein